MTANYIYKKILALLDEYTDDGVEIAQEENIDIEKKVILFIDMEQKELWKQNKLTKQIELTHKPQENRLGLFSNFELIDFEGDAQYYPNENGVDHVQGYSIQVNAEASDNATITYQELVGGTWTDLVTIAPTGIDTMTTYKGVLNVSSITNPVRLKVDGTEHFIHQHRALWKLKYKTDSVPTYEPWVKVDMPTDFNGVDAIVEEFEVRQYAQTQNYKIENYRDFYYAFDFDGNIRITYKPIASTITSLDDTIELDDVLAQSIVYGVVAKLGFYENPDLVNWSEGKRNESKLDASLDDVPSAETMVNYYG